MARKKVFVPEDDEVYSDENFDETNYSNSKFSKSKTTKSKRKKLTVVTEEYDEDATELEDNADSDSETDEKKIVKVAPPSKGKKKQIIFDKKWYKNFSDSDSEDEERKKKKVNVKEVEVEVKDMGKCQCQCKERQQQEVLPESNNTHNLGSEQEQSNNIHTLSHYWPHGLKTDEPENKNLLYLYQTEFGFPISPCNICNTGQYFEITFYYRYSLNGHEAEVTYDKHPAALAKFLEKIEMKESTSLPFILLLAKPICCPAAKSTPFYYVKRHVITSQMLKFYCHNSIIQVYLKVDPASIPEIPNCIDADINGLLKTQYYKPLQIAYESSGAEGLSDTFDFPEAEIPSGFNLSLRSYQLRSISWMKQIEDIESSDSNSIANNSFTNDEECYMKLKLGETPYYVEFNGSRNVTRTPETTKLKPLRFYGGILADNTGSGKTITTIGLIHSFPFNLEKQELRRARFHNLVDYVPSKASLIICPSNILKQWMSEAKRCNPKLKVYGFSTIWDHRRVSWQDIIDADIVVISYQFLLNASYSNFKKEANFTIKEIQDYAYLNGRVDLHKIHFHRLILDEFHELKSAGTSVREFSSSFQADYVWGLTGTPSFEQISDQFLYFKPSERFLKVYNDNNYAKKEFNHKFIKRNVPDLQLPPIEPETVWVDLSPHELALLSLEGRETSVRQEIMMCSHYQLTEKGTVSVDAFMSVNDLQTTMSSKKGKGVERLKASTEYLQSQLETILTEKPESDVTHLRARLKASENQLKLAESDFNYFESVFKIINDPEKYNCPICYDQIDESNLSILPCSHLYCYDCIKAPVAKNNTCPLCSRPATLKEIYRIRIPKPEVTIKCDKLDGIDTSKYGSKLIKLYRYITNLIETSENARIILFLQYRDLTEFIAESFKELNINYVRVAGNVFQRQNAINKFRDSKDIRLIMMSSEDSVSGINLTQATHVILLHPFYTGMGEQADLAYEKQGISRAYRFGLQHPLKVVRFAARGTIEERITLQRENIIL